MRPIVYSCFLNVKTVITPKLFLFVLLNTSSMHFLCLSFRVGSFGIKRRASRLASSTEQYDTLRFCWKIFDYHMILTKQFDRNGGSVGSSFFLLCSSTGAWLTPRARPTLVSVRLWDAKKSRRLCKQDKAWRDVVGYKLSVKKYIFKYWTIKLKIIGNDSEALEYNLLLWSKCIWKPEDYRSQNT